MTPKIHIMKSTKDQNDVDKNHQNLQIKVTVEGPVGPAGNKFSVNTVMIFIIESLSKRNPSLMETFLKCGMQVRRNPANPGAVTGSATYASFLSSLLR